MVASKGDEKLYNLESDLPFKYEVQTGLFKDPVLTGSKIFHLGYKKNQFML